MELKGIPLDVSGRFNPRKPRKGPPRSALGCLWLPTLGSLGRRHLHGLLDTEGAEVEVVDLRLSGSSRFPKRNTGNAQDQNRNKIPE
jgi:hypothetical protein